MKKNKLLHSFHYAFKGIGFAWQERNFKLHIISSLLAIALSLFLNISKMEWCIILLCIGMVLMAEIFNTAIEKTIDLVSPQIQPKAGVIKDLAAAAVLTISITAASIAVIIFYPYILQILS